MNDYVELRFNLNPCEEYMTDLLAAMLADVGFESFVPDESGLTAYVKESDYTGDMDALVKSLPFEPKCEWSAVKVEGRDWNAEWEKNYFQPIVVGGECVIHSSFHKDVPQCKYDIVIDPKMAFGTGHHSTTSLIIGRLLEMDLRGKSMVDMGTGTGILAILAAMRGASPVAAIEIDPFAYTNAVENVSLNSHPEIIMIEGDASRLEDVGFDADVFVANINRNVITADMDCYVGAMAQGATMLLSGFYVEDIPVVRAAAEKCGMRYVDYTEHKNWACVCLVKG